MKRRKSHDDPPHPGSYVRQHIIPHGMTVTKAAELLGIGRPALSNFLNGKAALSQEMARRLERAFEADRQELLDLQARYDRRDEAVRRPVVAGSHAPSLVQIGARDIEDWGDRIAARQHLAALLRRLIHSTGRDLIRIDFPAGDNAERHGRDGILEARAPTPWIPEAKSAWEFGCGGDPKRKVKQDYRARLKSVPARERRDMTFVFVTPRNWSEKEKWAAARVAEGEWKDVRVYDASDLEQWLEQSAPTQIWFAEQLGRPIDGFRSLDGCWSNWAEVCEPVLSPALFSMAEGSSDDFRRWLDAPPKRPFIVAAGSPEEALAFACHLSRTTKSATDEPSAGALVFDTPEAMRRFRAANAAPRIAIVHHTQVEREIGELYKRCHCVIVRPINDVESNPDIKLGLPRWRDFSDALESMGLSHDEANALARASGRSPTVLRRRLSTIPAIRAPDWAEDARMARILLPAALVGAWSKASPSDREVVRGLARLENEDDVESGTMELLALEDSPLWSTREYRGVVSRIDALFGIAKFVTEADLDTFFSIAERVLSETDPALGLPEGKRWAAALQDKVRDHSAALRAGIRETLVLLSVHGDTLFRSRLGGDFEARVSSLISRLLTPLTTDALLSHLDDLPDYAEAAPNAFLKLIESDLKTPDPAVFGLLTPVDSSLFGRCLRTGLLWALEGLAWTNLGRVSLVLARLSTIPIDDNWANKPIASLGAIYRSWLPRTAASLADRMRSLETLTKRFPSIGWQVCVAQLNTGPQFAIPSHRPRWRDDASNAGQGVTWEEFEESRLKALDLILAWPNHDQRTLGDLVELIHNLSEENRTKVWDLIDAWADTEADDKAKAGLRERIRRSAFTRRGRSRGVEGEALDRARGAYDRLVPRDPVVRHAWLFANSWIEPSADEIEAQDLDHEERHERIRGLRADAMKEIWTESGFDGLIELLSGCGAPRVVGESLEPGIPNVDERVDFLRRCASMTGPLQVSAEWCLCGFLWSVDDGARSSLLATAAVDADAALIARLYRCAPFGRHTWRLLDGYDSKAQDLYWREVMPEWNRHDEAELTEIVDRLLDVERPDAAFHAVHLDFSKIETSRLKRLLFDVGTADTESSEHYLTAGHDISEAMSELNGRSGVSRDEMVRLEFMYIQALDHSEYGIPNLERWISESPLGFVQVLALLFKRDDEGQDPPEWQIAQSEKRTALGSAAYGLLEHMSRIPGTEERGSIDVEALSRWIAEARRLCAEHGRAALGDQYIGQLLSRGPADDGGIRPCLAVSEAMERVASDQIGFGFSIGIRNGRGVTGRLVGEGGDQERDLAETYRAWARQRSPDYPYVGSILEDIAAEYDREAQWHDEKAEIDRRLEH